jgi:hypothetical protein
VTLLPAQTQDVRTTVFPVRSVRIRFHIGLRDERPRGTVDSCREV